MFYLTRPELDHLITACAAARDMAASATPPIPAELAICLLAGDEEDEDLRIYGLMGYLDLAEYEEAE